MARSNTGANPSSQSILKYASKSRPQKEPTASTAISAEETPTSGGRVVMSEQLEARFAQLEADNKALKDEMAQLKEQVSALEKELKERPELKRPEVADAASRSRNRSNSTAASLQTASAAATSRARRQSQGGGATKALSFLELLGITQQPTTAAPAPGAAAAPISKRQASQVRAFRRCLCRGAPAPRRLWFKSFAPHCTQAPQQAKMPLASDALPVLHTAVKGIEKHFVGSRYRILLSRRRRLGLIRGDFRGCHRRRPTQLVLPSQLKRWATIKRTRRSRCSSAGSCVPRCRAFCFTGSSRSS